MYSSVFSQGTKTRPSQVRPSWTCWDGRGISARVCAGHRLVRCARPKVENDSKEWLLEAFVSRLGSSRGAQALLPSASPVPYKSLRLLAVCPGSIGPGLIGDVDPEDSGVVYERDTCVGVSMTWISSPAVGQVVWGARAGAWPPEKKDARNMPMTHRPSAAMYLFSQR